MNARVTGWGGLVAEKLVPSFPRVCLLNPGLVFVEVELQGLLYCIGRQRHVRRDLRDLPTDHGTSFPEGGIPS